MMPERTLEQVLESVRALLENRKVKCPGCGLQCDCVPGTEYHCTNHYKCGGTGQILNPAYAPLLALVREACPRCSVEQPIPDCAWRCRGTRYYTRIAYWEDVPNGALEGALRQALIPLMPDVPKYSPIFVRWEDLMLNLQCLLNTEGDTRIPALEAVKTWLKGEA